MIKYVKDYMPALQQELLKKYGVRFTLQDLKDLTIFPFKNIIKCALRGDEVSVKGKFTLVRKRQ